MSKLNASKIFYPGNRFLQESFGVAQGWIKPLDFILRRAVAVDINYETDAMGNEPIKVPFAIKAKIIGDDISSENPKEDYGQWFPPLLPIHNIALPQLGEEVFIVYEANTKDSMGYWIGRANTSTSIAKYYARDYVKSNDQNVKTGFPFDPKKLEDNIEPLNNLTFSLPVRPGDVIQQGRSDTFIRHTFSPETKEGLLEFGIKEKRKYVLGDHNSHIGSSITKTMHSVSATLDSLVENYNFADSYINKDIPRNTIVNIAERHINVSTNDIDDALLSRVVLGDKIYKILVDTYDIINNINSIVTDNYNMLITHTHLINGENITIPLSPELLEITVPVKQKYTTTLIKNRFAENMENSFFALKDKISSFFNSLLKKEFLSKSQFVN